MAALEILPSVGSMEKPNYTFDISTVLFPHRYVHYYFAQGVFEFENGTLRSSSIIDTINHILRVWKTLK